MHNKNASVLFCLRTTIQIQEIENGSFLLPKHLYIINNIKALASCTTSVYVNLSKNSFFMPPHLVFERKRVQRYCFFPNHQNFSRKNFSFRTEKLQVLTNIKFKNHLHLIIYCARVENDTTVLLDTPLPTERCTGTTNPNFLS